MQLKSTIEKKVSLIVAVAKNKVIGYQGEIPWRIKGEQKIFREYTMGKTVIMGRKTYESLPKVLDGREIIVVTRNRTYQAKGVKVAYSLPEVLSLAKEEVMIAGGGELYKEAMPFVTHLYLSELDIEPKGDTFFAYDKQAFEMVFEKKYLLEVSCRFRILKKYQKRDSRIASNEI